MKINSFPFRKSLRTRYNVLCTVSALPSITLNEIKNKKKHDRAVPSCAGTFVHIRSHLPPRPSHHSDANQQACTRTQAHPEVAATAGLEF